MIKTAYEMETGCGDWGRWGGPSVVRFHLTWIPGAFWEAGRLEDLSTLCHQIGLPWLGSWAGWRAPQPLPCPVQSSSLQPGPAFPLQDAGSVLDSASGSGRSLAALGGSPAAPSAGSAVIDGRGEVGEQPSPTPVAPDGQSSGGWFPE